jgi:hypothetical protein
MFVRTPYGTQQQIYSSCKNIKNSFPSAASNSYTIIADGATRTVYCEQTLDGGGWQMIWKHSYYQVFSWDLCGCVCIGVWVGEWVCVWVYGWAQF